MTIKEFIECYKMAKKIGLSLPVFLAMKRAINDHDKESDEREERYLEGEEPDVHV